MDKIKIPSKEQREIERLKQTSADQDFALMLAEGEALTARQEVADLNFTLMINGVI